MISIALTPILSLLLTKQWFNRNKGVLLNGKSYKNRPRSRVRIAACPDIFAPKNFPKLQPWSKLPASRSRAMCPICRFMFFSVVRILVLLSTKLIGPLLGWNYIAIKINFISSVFDDVESTCTKKHRFLHFCPISVLLVFLLTNFSNNRTLQSSIEAKMNQRICFDS